MARTLVAGVACAVAVIVAAAVVVAVIRSSASRGTDSTDPGRYPARYELGVYEPDAPGSYVGVDQFAHAIGRQPNLVSYYSTWLGNFQVGFASSAAKNGAVTLVQIDTGKASLASVARGQYDNYFRSYADEVKAFGAPVVLSLDHEMNGDWYSWGYRHTSPAVFVAAWRHVVSIFREQGANNVTWMWTINVIHPHHGVPAPDRWWPGKSYVNWVGIDGYYYSSSYTFDSLFGPTIAAVRELTGDPILIAETAVAPTAGQPAKIANLFAGIRLYGLLGFVWFDSVHIEDWRLSGPAAIAALRRGAETYRRSVS
jgi:mannan endo-1,4-beta-mannosidase